MWPRRLDHALALPETLANMAVNSESHSAMSAKIISLTTEGMPVEALTARMKAGDEHAFELFHDQYCDRLFRYLIVLCRGDEQLTRDLLQITMLKVVRSIRPFSGETELWNWLAAIARNTFLDYVRKSRRAPHFETLAPEQTGAISSEGQEDDVLWQALEEALAQLPAEERALIESFYFQSGSYRSVAAQQDTSAKAIESRLARVRQKLRQAILNHLRYENS